MKILLVDDHAILRESLAMLLQSMLTEPLVAWHAGSCEQAFSLIESGGAPDMVLIDLGLPGMSGIEGIGRLRELAPTTPIVVLSSADDRETVLRALDAGAMCFIPKTATSGVFESSLRLVMAKGIALPQSVSTRADAKQAAEALVTRPADLGLTQRQSDVLYQILQGSSAKLIARELSLSASTVKTHTSAVLRALNVTTRTQAVVKASDIGLRFDRPVSR